MKNIVLLFLLVILNFSISYASDGIKVETLAKDSHSWDKAVLPSYPKGQPEITILKIIIAPDTALPAHYHPVINAGYLVKGELTVIKSDGQKLVLKAGDPLIELVNQEHYGKNTGKEDAELIVFYAGVKDKPITVKY